jgi:hypothetical protein
MKVLNLQCRHGHAFEGWFASHADYESQRGRGLVACPVCSDAEVAKMPSAPRLNLGHDATATHSVPAAPAPAQAVAPMTSQHLQAAWMKMVRHVMTHTEDVGTKFAEEARKIHYGETDNRNIRGQASREETEALLDEGIDILPLPVPAGLKEPLQ